MEFGVVGFGIGLLGTLVGAGGGFLAVPLLILAYHFSPAQAAGTSLLMVLCNASAGAIAYARQGKIDYGAGMLFAVATYPGAMLGAQVTGLMGSRGFSVVFGLLLAAAAGLMVLHQPPGPPAGPRTAKRSARAGSAPDGRAPAGRAPGGSAPAGSAPGGLDWPGWRPVRRMLAAADGTVYRWQYRPLTGFVISLGVGFVSSLLGIGGGIIHVPALVYALHFPAHLATATAHFVLAWSALVGVLAHLAAGNVVMGPGLALGVGAACGAPLGAWLAQRVNPRQILLVLAGALFLVAVRLVLG